MKFKFPILLIFLIIQIPIFSQRRPPFHNYSSENTFGFILGATKTKNTPSTNFILGITFDKKIKNNSFIQAGISLSYNDFILNGAVVEGTYFEFRTFYVYKSFERINKPILFLGPDYKKDLSNPAFNQFSLNIGTGIEFRLPYFTLTPQYHYSFGEIFNCHYITFAFKG